MTGCVREYSTVCAINYVLISLKMEIKSIEYGINYIRIEIMCTSVTIDRWIRSHKKNESIEKKI